MYLIFIKEDGKHVLYDLAENLDEVRKLVNNEDLKEKIKNGKAYLMEGKINLIRPETTPELLDIKEIQKLSLIHI